LEEVSEEAEGSGAVGAVGCTKAYGCSGLGDEAVGKAEAGEQVGFITKG
jgi:hypothetical protein